MAWILLRPSNYKQVAPLVRTGGSRHTGLAALPHRNIHKEQNQNSWKKEKEVTSSSLCLSLSQWQQVSQDFSTFLERQRFFQTFRTS